MLAIGDPFGVGQTVTHGIVSALARTQVGITDYQFFIQTDAAINPGNSGGALVDLDGKLVGINTAIFSRSGGSQGIGFAIPANMVRVVVASAKSGGTAVKRPWLGAKLQAVTPEIADSMGLKRPAGALVAKRAAGQARRRRRGCKAGDLIVAVDGQAVDDPNAFDYRFATQPLGGTAKLDAVCAAARTADVTVRARDRAGGAARTRSPSGPARRSPAPRWPTCRRRSPTNCRSRTSTRASSCSTSQTARIAQRRFPRAATWCWRSTGSKIDKTRELERVSQCRRALWRITIRRGGQRVNLMVERVAVVVPLSPATTDAWALFRASALRYASHALPHQTTRPDVCSPPPASTRTRRVRWPTGCARRSSTRWSGRTICSGPDGALTRMLATRSLGSLVFWGPPGTGKTTVARLLAQATDLHFEQISAIFTGVADLKKVFEEARRRRELGQGTLLFVDEIHRFNRAQQD